LEKSLRRAALALAGAALLGSPALAQNSYGQGQFTPDANAPIHLHMPVHLRRPAKARAPRHRKAPTIASARAASAPAAAPPSAEAAPIPFGGYQEPPPPPQPKKAAAAARAPRKVTPVPSRPASYSERRKAVQEVLSGPANSTATSDSSADVSTPDAAIPFSFDSASPPPPKPKPASRPAPPKAKSGAIESRKPQLASLGPAPKQATPKQAGLAKPKGDPHAGLTKQGQVLFAGADAAPQADDVKSIATTLNSALDAGAARVELEAYGGGKGDKSSDARRLSLRRALAVRQLLIDNGVPADRIDVKALGGADDNGTADRVDVFIKA
jgi:outer membrane protein OmpA-like peptidoglycan-associated protein